jgi:hypothetical protein
MGLFKSKDERRMEREMRIRRGVKQIEKSIRQQEKFQEEFITHARQARKIGDDGQYASIRGSLKRTAAVKKTLERQLLAIKNAQLLQQQARSSQQFASSMNLIAAEIGKAFGEMDLAKTQGDWEKAMHQAESMEERMDLFLEGVEDAAAGPSTVRDDAVGDDEIDRLIEADVLAEERAELGKLDDLETELERELGVAKEKD